MRIVRKSLYIICGCVIVFALSGCKSDRRTEVFVMPYTLDFELQAGLNTLETHFYRITNVPSVYQAQLDASGRQDSDIVSITPKTAELSTVFRDENLDFIRQVFVRVFDPLDANNINQEVFYLDPVPPNVRTVIHPFPGLADVKNIASLPLFGVEVGISLWQVTPKSFDMRLEFELSANAD